MLLLKRTTSADTDFQKLVAGLDKELAERDGKEHSFYAQYNTIDSIKYAVILYSNNNPIGCGAIKEFSSGIMEIKRMFVLPECRGKGFATAVLDELEKWAVELNFQKCLLETGKKQPEAISLYIKNGYKIIPNFGQYAGVENSVCFEKIVSDVL